MSHSEHHQLMSSHAAKHRLADRADHQNPRQPCQGAATAATTRASAPMADRRIANSSPRNSQTILPPPARKVSSHRGHSSCPQCHQRSVDVARRRCRATAEQEGAVVARQCPLRKPSLSHAHEPATQLPADDSASARRARKTPAATTASATSAAVVETASTSRQARQRRVCSCASQLRRRMLAWVQPSDCDGLRRLRFWTLEINPSMGLRFLASGCSPRPPRLTLDRSV